MPIPRRTSPALVACAFLCLQLCTAGLQQRQPTFKSGVEAVVLDVSVLGRDGRPVRGLTAADFTVLEDGRPQPISAFKAIDLENVVEPYQAQWLREVAPDVRRNDEFRERRVVVIVLDSSTPLMARDLLLVKRLGRTVIDQLPPDAIAAIVYTLNKDAGQVFTKDRAKLRAAVERYNATPGFTPDDYDPTAETLYRSVLSTLRGTAEWMADLPEGRKAIIFVSAGIPLDVEVASRAKMSADLDAGDQIRSLNRELTAVIEAAGRANVSFYALDPGGLRTRGSPKSQDFLKTLSDTTGGFAVVDTNNPAPEVAQIYRENASYYLLGYQSTDSRTSGRFRRTEVRLKRPGVTVRTRTGHTEPAAPRPEPGAAQAPAPAPLTAALGRVLPIPDVGLQVAATPFRGRSGREADVAVVIDVEQTLPDGSAAGSDQVDVVTHAYNMGAKLRASDRATVRLTFRPASGRPSRFGVLSLLSLPPGRYRVRVAARSAALDRTGSVYADLDVPDYSKVPLSLSGVLLDVTTPAVPSAPTEKLAHVVPTLPTAQREFTTGDQVGAFVRVYQGGKGGASTVVVIARLVDASDNEVWSATEALGAESIWSRTHGRPSPRVAGCQSCNGTLSAQHHRHPRCGDGKARRPIQPSLRAYPRAAVYSDSRAVPCPRAGLRH